MGPQKILKKGPQWPLSKKGAIRYSPGFLASTFLKSLSESLFSGRREGIPSQLDLDSAVSLCHF